MNSNPNHKQSSRRTPATTRRDLSQVKLRPVTEPEREEWEASTRDKDLLQRSFWSLDDLVEYPFKVCGFSPPRDGFIVCLSQQLNYYPSLLAGRRRRLDPNC